MKIPRCFKYYKDDRICDVCSFNEECVAENEIRNALEHAEWRCKFKKFKDSTFGNSTYCTKFSDKYSCKVEKRCFPQLIRKMKLNKINEKK